MTLSLLTDAGVSPSPVCSACAPGRSLHARRPRPSDTVGSPGAKPFIRLDSITAIAEQGAALTTAQGVTDIELAITSELRTVRWGETKVMPPPVWMVTP